MKAEGQDCSERQTLQPGTVQVTIPGLPQYIGVARQAVDAVSENLQLSADDRMAVRLAVGEACNNAVFHSSLPHPDSAIGRVVVACRVLPDALEIDVENDGNGYHPTSAGHSMPGPFAEHGRGVPLMEMLMDSVEYLSRCGNTIVRMRKLRQGRDSGANALSPSLSAHPA